MNVEATVDGAIDGDRGGDVFVGGEKVCGVNEVSAEGGF